MAYAKEKLEQFEHALRTLEELMPEEPTRIIKDAAIQRFEYSVELFWKALKVFLLESGGVDAPTPKDAIRKAGSTDILTAEEVSLALEMIDDRNETSHMYSESFADKLFAKLPAYAHCLRAACEKLKSLINPAA